MGSWASKLPQIRAPPVTRLRVVLLHRLSRRIADRVALEDGRHESVSTPARAQDIRRSHAQRQAPSPAFRPRRTMSSKPRIMVVGPIRKRADRTQQNCKGVGRATRKHEKPPPMPQQRTTPLRNSVYAPPLRTRRTPQKGPGTRSARPPSRGKALRHSTLRTRSASLWSSTFAAQLA